MASLGITAADVAQAIREQNVQVPAGQVGQPPATRGQSFQYSLRVQGRLGRRRPSSQNIIVGSKPDGSFIRLRDIGRVELGARELQQRLDSSTASRRPPSRSRWCRAQTRSRPRTSSRRELARLAASFPKGLDYRIVYDTSEFVKASVEEVVQTFVEALLLVLIVVFLFLQSWRTTLIPMLAVPVSLIATFAAFQLLGFSINTLSLFGMVLAIGIVVDDAIVVVEAVEHNMQPGTRRPRRDDQGDGRGAGAGGRHRTDARGGVHADGLHPRRDRAALQAVRGDGRGVDDVLGARRADADAGAVHDAAEAARGQPRRRSRASSMASTPASTGSTHRYGAAAAALARRTLMVMLTIGAP